MKEIREPHEVKKKSFHLGGNRTHDLRIRSTVTLPTELRGRSEKVGDDLGGESQRRESKRGTNECAYIQYSRILQDCQSRVSNFRTAYIELPFIPGE